MEKKLNIQQLSINLLKPYTNNPRDNQKSIRYLEKSIKEYGFTIPITVDEDYVIVTGHSRYFAAKNIGLSEVPVIVLDNLSDEEVKQYRLADNAVAEHSTFDFSDAEIRMKEMAADDDFFADVFWQFAPPPEEFKSTAFEEDDDDFEDEDAPEDEEDEDEEEKECICPYCLHEFNLEDSEAVEEQWKDSKDQTQTDD